jgi:hypothetical protein
MRKYLMAKTILLGIEAERKFSSVVEKLSEERGSFLEEVIKYVIYIVVGALLLAGIYALFKTVILPTLQTKVQDMFNYTA